MKQYIEKRAAIAVVNTRISLKMRRKQTNPAELRMDTRMPRSSLTYISAHLRVGRVHTNRKTTKHQLRTDSAESIVHFATRPTAAIMLPKATLFVLVVAMIFAHAANGRSVRVARAPKPALANRFNDKQCETEQTPCGWAVYIDRSRDVDYYIINCNCKDNELCTKDEDDMSAKTFIYRCLVNYTNATAAVPPS